jgi:hypothetical protein
MPILFRFIPSEYYKIDEWDDDEASPTAGQAEIMIAKHRNGSIENVRLKLLDTSGSLIIWRILVEVMMIYHQYESRGQSFYYKIYHQQMMLSGVI